jgi:hypothetical protein
MKWKMIAWTRTNKTNIDWTVSSTMVLSCLMLFFGRLPAVIEEHVRRLLTTEYSISMTIVYYEKRRDLSRSYSTRSLIGFISNTLHILRRVVQLIDNCSTMDRFRDEEVRIALAIARTRNSHMFMIDMQPIYRIGKCTAKSLPLTIDTEGYGIDRMWIRVRTISLLLSNSRCRSTMNDLNRT